MPEEQQSLTSDLYRHTCKHIYTYTDEQNKKKMSHANDFLLIHF